MKKKIIKRSLDDGRNFGDYFSIDYLENFIAEMKDIGATHIDIEHDDSEFVFSGYLEREETDKEYEYRMGAEERLKNAKMANDLKIYERIKAEYNL